MKRFLSLFLSLIMVMGVFLSVPVTVNAAGVGDLGFEFDAADGSYTVIGCDPDASGDLVIPERYNNYRVRKIDVYAFGGCDNLTSITIPNTVISIGAYAFNYCTGLKSVTIPDSVTSIGNWAFKDCSNLRSVTIPKSVKSIGAGTFYSCCRLESVSIADGVTDIGDEAFYCCEKLKVVSIPESVKNIGDGAFNETGNIQEIYLGNDVALEYLAWYTSNSEYKNVKKVTLGNKVTYVPESVFQDCKLLESVTLGDSVESIYPCAFVGCVKLKSLTIPDKLTYIGDQAFYKCEALELITMGNSVEIIGGRAFKGCNNLSKVYISDIAKWCSIDFRYDCANPLEIAKNLYINGSLANNVVIPGTVTKINDGVFYNCKSLKSIEIPESVQAIGEDAFYGCSNLNSIKAVCNSYAPKYFYYNAPEFYDKLDLTHNSISDWIVGKVPNCMQEGMRYKKCWYCGATMETETLPKGEHLISKDSAVEATCTKAGKTEGSHCTYCHEVLVPQTIIPAKGHTSSDWLTDKAATVNGAGSKHKECTECGEVLETAVIPQLKPAAPKLTGVANAANGVKITWGKVSGADKYRVYRKIKGGAWEKVCDTTATAVVDKKAKSGVTYYYTVRAINEAGGGSYNKTGLAIRFVGTPKLTAIANGKNYVQVNWGKVAGADGYIVYRKASGEKGWTKIATVKGGTTVKYRDTKVASGKGYTYTVRAYDGNAKSSYNATGLTIKLLAMPKLSKVTSAKSGVTVKWGKVAGATGYIVYCKTGNGGWQKIATVKGNAKVSYLDKTAKKGTTYTYTVKAYSGSYKSAHNTTGLKIKDKY